MIISPCKSPLVEPGDDLFTVLLQTIPTLQNGSVVVISSKIIALCQGETRPITTDKKALIVEECEWYVPAESNPYNATITITGHKLAAAAGIDESNAHNCLVLLPRRTNELAIEIMQWLQNTFAISECGVVIIDSRSTPLNLGTTGQTIAYAGIAPLKDYRGTDDLFGREIIVSRLNVLNCIASAAVLVMGEGNEQQPVAIIEDAKMISFKDADDVLDYDREEDLYAELLRSNKWIKGGGGYLQRQHNRPV